MEMSWLARKREREKMMKIIYRLKRLFEYATHCSHEKYVKIKNNKKGDYFSSAAHSIK